MPEPDPGRRNAIGALVVIAILVIGGLWLQRHMRATSQMEDCLLEGRKTCAPVAQ